MSNNFKSVQRAIPLCKINLDVLFALRLLFDDPLDIVDIEQDIHDLKHFPERLFGSYRQEWETYITRAIVHRLRGLDAPDTDQFLMHTLNSVKQIIDNDERYQRLYQMIRIANNVHCSSNTTVLNTPIRQQVFSLLNALPNAK